MSEKPLYDKSAKDRERARQAEAAKREAARIKKEEACQADGGHVWKHDGYCAGCDNYNGLYNRTNTRDYPD